MNPRPQRKSAKRVWYHSVLVVRPCSQACVYGYDSFHSIMGFVIIYNRSFRWKVSRKAWKFLLIIKLLKWINIFKNLGSNSAAQMKADLFLSGLVGLLPDAASSNLDELLGYIERNIRNDIAWRTRGVPGVQWLLYWGLLQTHSLWILILRINLRRMEREKAWGLIDL